MNTKFSKKIGLIALSMVLLCSALPAWALTATQVAKLLASDGETWDDFGYAIAIDGDTALIGAYNDDKVGYDTQGSAYVFTRDAGGNWTEQIKLKATDAASSQYFGVSVALEGDTAVICATYGDGDPSGSAYVFTRDVGGNWTQQAKLVAADGPQSGFGEWVALDGDTVLVGAQGWLYDNGNPSGSAYVFSRDASGNWTQQGKLLAADGAPGDHFGWSVALDGDTALIGAWRNDSAYVFTRDAQGLWTQEEKLVAADGVGYMEFGWSVALSVDTALIGAECDNDCAGSAYVFTRDAGSNWTQQAKLIGTDVSYGQQFGGSVALDGDTALIGSIADDDNGPDSGSAYVFTRSGSTWTQQAKLIADDGIAGEFFGYSVALDGDTALISSDQGSFGGNRKGSAYVFKFSPPNNTQVELP
jgi:hypothetical protein